MWIACLVTAFVLCFFVSLLNEENAPYMISGVNTMPKEKHQNIDFKGLVKHYKRSTYSLSAALVLVALSTFIMDDVRIHIVIFISVVTLGLLHLLFFGGKYDQNPQTFWNQFVLYSILVCLVLGAILVCYDVLTSPIETLNL